MEKVSAAKVRPSERPRPKRKQEQKAKDEPATLSDELPVTWFID